MVKIRIGRRKVPQFPRKRGTVTRDFSNLQRTEFDPDKVQFNDFQVARNVFHKGGNAETRNGLDNLISITGLLGVEMYENEDGNTFVGLVKQTFIPAFLTGGTAATSSAVTWALVSDGEFRISIDGVQYDIAGIDFSAVSTMTDVANIIQAAVRTATGSTEQVEFITDHFLIESVDLTSSSAITVTDTVGTPAGTDISGNGGVAYLDAESGRGTVTNNVADTTKSALITINRTTGAQTVNIINISGTGRPSFISLSNFLYLANGTANIQTFRAITTNNDDELRAEITLPSTEIAKLLETDGERLWTATVRGALLFSVAESGQITSFTQSGTTIDRAGVADSKITNFVAIASSGRRIMTCSADRTEALRIPDFQEIQTFEDKTPILEKGWDTLGVTSAGALLHINGTFHLKPPKDGVLYTIQSGSTTVKEIRTDLQQLEDFDFKDCEMAYDQTLNLLYFSAIDSATTNDIVVVYNLQDGTFSFYDNVFVKDWAFDKDDIFYLATFGDNIENAFKSTIFTDNGAKINCVIETAVTYAGNIEFFKKVRKLFFNVKTFEDLTITAKLFIDEKIGGNKPESFSQAFTIIEDSSPFEDFVAGFGLGVWGAAATQSESEASTEFYDINTKVNQIYARISMSLEWSSSNKQHIRGMGIFSETTERQIRTITMTE